MPGRSGMQKLCRSTTRRLPVPPNTNRHTSIGGRRLRQPAGTAKRAPIFKERCRSTRQTPRRQSSCGGRLTAVNRDRGPGIGKIWERDLGSVKAFAVPCSLFYISCSDISFHSLCFVMSHETMKQLLNYSELRKNSFKITSIFKTQGDQ